jgi:transcriptional regulator of nitric oxide reductase
VDEALKLAFPGGVIERETVFLTEEQRLTAEKEGGSEVSSSIVTRFSAKGEDAVALGWAYLDTHRVRTLPETLMIVLDPNGTVRHVEVVTFREPLEYMPRVGWYEQYRGQELDDDLAIKRDIRPVTGATLTARATTEAVRRVLAVHKAITGSGVGR